MSAVISKTLRNVLSRGREELKKEMTALEKLGFKFTLDNANSAQTELELDVLGTINDPLNDADFKIRRIYTLIVLSFKRVSAYDNPRIAPLIAACNGMMSKWNILTSQTRKTFGNYIVAEMQIPYALPNGLFQIRVQRESLSYPVFGHQFAQYMAGSEWQVEQMKRLYGKETKENQWKWLTFTPIQSIVQKGPYREPTQEEREILEGTEYFANTEIVYRMFTIYSWMHREKFTFPNTPIVIQAQPQMGVGFGGKPVPTSSFIQTQDKPTDDGTPGIQTME